MIPKSVKKFSSETFFIYGPATFVFLGDCPEIVDTIDFLVEPTIYYNADANGWDDCVWKGKYPVEPIQ